MSKFVTKMNLSNLITQKKLPLDFFTKNQGNKLTLDSNLSCHVEKAFDIYKVPYEEGKERIIHGVSHVSRSAAYIRVLYGLYKRYDPNTNISEEDLKLLELAAIFHDSGREGEGEDIWEHDSATILYFYLTKVLKLPHEKAKNFSEIILNKDYKEGCKYYYLDSVEGENITWKVEEN